MDTHEVCNFADYFVICTGESARQIQAIYDEVAYLLKKAGASPHHYEGTIDTGWLLLDFGDVIIHIFAPSEREYYQLDRLWSNAVPILRIQ